jgi:hypothetical protein
VWSARSRRTVAATAAVLGLLGLLAAELVRLLVIS